MSRTWIVKFRDRDYVSLSVVGYLRGKKDLINLIKKRFGDQRRDDPASYRHIDAAELSGTVPYTRDSHST